MSEEIQINVSPEDWDTFDMSLVLEDGYLLWFTNHPDSNEPIQVIGNGTDSIEDLTPLTVAGAKYLYPGYKAMEEKKYTISAAGWYKFAATSAISYYSTLANFSFEFHGSTEVGSASACLARNLQQGDSDLGTCEYLPGKSMRTTALGQIRVRMGLDSSSGSSAGITGEVYVPTSGTLTVQKYGALAGISGAMLSLVDDMTSTTDGFLPDEATTATYLEAGAYFEKESTDESNVFGWIGNKIDSDSIRVTWPMPRHYMPGASAVTIDAGSASLLVIDGAGVESGLVTPGFSVTDESFENEYIYFTLNSTGQFTSHNSGPLAILSGGSGFNVTLEV
jgi:hypothetical protein